VLQHVIYTGAFAQPRRFYEDLKAVERAWLGQLAWRHLANAKAQGAGRRDRLVRGNADA